MNITHDPPSSESMRILPALRKAVRQKLEEKRRLGHDHVVWEGDHPVFIGEDAPDVGDAVDETASPA